MLWVSAWTTIQTAKDGHPVRGTGLYPGRQPIRPSKHHHPSLYLAEEESKYMLSFCAGRCCSGRMENYICQHSRQWGWLIDETTAFWWEAQRFCAKYTASYIRANCGLRCLYYVVWMTTTWKIVVLLCGWLPPEKLLFGAIVCVKYRDNWDPCCLMEVLGQLRPAVLLCMGDYGYDQVWTSVLCFIFYGKEVAMLGELFENDAMNTWLDKLTMSRWRDLLERSVLVVAVTARYVTAG